MGKPIEMSTRDYLRAGEITDLMNAKYRDPVDQQKVLELCLAIHVMRVTGEPDKQRFIIASVVKHIEQFLELRGRTQ